MVNKTYFDLYNMNNKLPNDIEMLIYYYKHNLEFIDVFN